MSLSEEFLHLFGRQIKEKRRDLRLTQMELSERLGISRTKLANIETGAQRTSVFLLAHLAQVLESSTDDLVPKIAEAKAQLKQSQKVSLPTETTPVLLSRELKTLNISVDSGSTLEGALAQIHRQNAEPKVTKP